MLLSRRLPAGRREEGRRESATAAHLPPEPSAPPAQGSASLGRPSGLPAVTRERLVAPQGRFLPVRDSTLLSALQAHLGLGSASPGAQRLAQVQGMLAACVRQDLDGSGRELLDGFERLASGATPAELSGLAGGEAGRQTGQEHAKGEDALRARFLSQLCSAMAAAGYRQLTAGEWEAALCEDFLFTLPVTANYSAMEPGLIPPGQEREPWTAEQALPPCGPSSRAAGARRPPRQLQGRALLWHRGARPVQTTTPAWRLKLDLLISFWLLQPLWAALMWLLAQLHLRPPLRPAPGVSTSPFADPSAVSGTSTKRGTERGTSQALVEGGSSTTGQAAAEASSESPPMVIERRTIARAFPDGASVWCQLARPVQLQEACFRDVVLLYSPAGTAGGTAGRRETVGAPEARLVLKQYNDVPLADLEMVLPGAVVHLPPNLYVSLAFTALAGLAAAATAVWQSAWGAGLLKTLAVILLSRAYALFTYVTNERTAIVNHMTQMLYERTAASQSAVLHTLNAELAGQRARELLLCYCVLLQAGRPLTEVERHELLAARVGLPHAQIQVGEPVSQLRAWELVHEAAAGVGATAGEGGAGLTSAGDQGQPPALAAVPLETAAGALRKAWAGLTPGGEGSGEAEGAGRGGQPGGAAAGKERAAASLPEQPPAAASGSTAGLPAQQGPPTPVLPAAVPASGASRLPAGWAGGGRPGPRYT